MYSSNYYSSDISSFLTGGIFLIIMLIMLGISLISYISMGLMLYNAAKEKGRNDEILAWIPIANNYLLIELGGGNPLMLLLLIGSIIPIIGSLCLLGLSIYLFIMTYKVLTMYNVNPVLVIISFFITPLIIVCYFIAYKNAKARLNQRSYN